MQLLQSRNLFLTLISSRFEQRLAVWNIDRIISDWRKSSFVFSINIFQLIYMCKIFTCTGVGFNGWTTKISCKFFEWIRIKSCYLISIWMCFPMDVSTNFKFNLHIINVYFSIFNWNHFLNISHRNFLFEKNKLLLRLFRTILFLLIFKYIFHVPINFLFPTHIDLLFTHQVR